MNLKATQSRCSPSWRVVKGTSFLLILAGPSQSLNLHYMHHSHHPSVRKRLRPGLDQAASRLPFPQQQSNYPFQSTALFSSASSSDTSWYTGERHTIASSQDELTEKEKAQVLKDYDVPTVKDVMKFAVPAIGVWLCVPLLSMIDTSTVGLMAGTAQQASLNPAIAGMTYSSKLMAFLFSGTTALIAGAQERDRRDKANGQSKPQTAKTLIGALQLSLLVGAGLGTFIFLFAPQLMAAIAGGTGTEPSIMEAAIKYVRIRCLGLPAAALLGSAQTACLAQRDVKLPLYATLVAAVANLGLDLAFIRHPHAWIGGASGAAWATTFSQVFAAGWVMRWLLTTQREAQQQTGNHQKSTRGFLANRMRVRDLLKLPSRETSKGFAHFVLPITTTQAGRCSASATLDHVVTSSLSTGSMAANQILCSVYYGLVPVAESLSLAAQSFVPGVAQNGDNDKKPKEQSYAMRRLLQSFLKASGLCGLILAFAMGTLPLYSGVFTSDASVRSLVTTVVPFLGLTCVKHGLFCSSEGILLGQKDMKFLGIQYSIYTFLIPYILLQVKKAALSGSSKMGLLTLWQIFVGYDVVRTSLMMARIVWLERKRKKQLI